MISIRRPDGEEIAGHLVMPAGGEDAPLVILLHEWWGLTSDIRDVAARLAAAGYRALALDLFRGKVASTAIEGMRLLKSFDFCASAEQDVRGALEQARGGHRAAVLGFSLGSGVALIAAAKVPGLDAAIGFYGIPRSPDLDPRSLRIPTQVHLADTDDFARPAAVERFSAALRAADAEVELYSYPASHGFFSTRPGGCFDAGAADLAWDRCLAFLAKHLESP